MIKTDIWPNSLKIKRLRGIFHSNSSHLEAILLPRTHLVMAEIVLVVTTREGTLLASSALRPEMLPGICKAQDRHR